MNEKEKQELLTALEFSDSRKTAFHLRRLLGKKTKFKEVNGHLFDLQGDIKSGWCVVTGCEMPDMDRAEACSCPASLEAVPSTQGPDF